MKKTLSILLSIIMIFSSFSINAFAAENEIPYNAPNGDFYRYVVLEDGTAEITYWKPLSNAVTDLSIPSTIDGYTVTSIGKSTAVLYGSSITSLSIPNTVKTIKTSAFQNFTKITSITIPDSVTEIGDFAFYSCKSVTSISLGTGVKTIGDSAFYSCKSVTSISLGTGAKTIGSSAFYGAAIKSLTIPANVTSIGSSCFGGCLSLTSLTIKSGVKTIEKHAFMNSKLSNISIPSSVKTIDSYAFSSTAENVTATIYSTDCKIDKYAFNSINGTTIKGYYGSTAMKLCKDNPYNGYKFKAIGLKGTTVNKLTSPKKKNMTVKINKQSKCTGYQIQYSKSSGFKSGNKTVTISKASTTSKTISGLTSKKKYYVRVRTYVNVGGSKTYSSWSKAKSIKVK